MVYATFAFRPIVLNEASMPNQRSCFVGLATVSCIWNSKYSQCTVTKDVMWISS